MTLILSSGSGSRYVWAVSGKVLILHAGVEFETVPMRSFTVSCLIPFQRFLTFDRLFFAYFSDPSISYSGFTFKDDSDEEVCVFISHCQVRCAAVFALGTFVGNSAERTDHSTTIDHNVAMMLAQLINDGSPIVRKVSHHFRHAFIIFISIIIIMVLKGYSTQK